VARDKDRTLEIVLTREDTPSAWASRTVNSTSGDISGPSNAILKVINNSVPISFPLVSVSIVLLDQAMMLKARQDIG
jgi:hypothetical protein